AGVQVDTIAPERSSWATGYSKCTAIVASVEVVTTVTSSGWAIVGRVVSGPSEFDPMLNVKLRVSTVSPQSKRSRQFCTTRRTLPVTRPLASTLPVASAHARPARHTRPLNVPDNPEGMAVMAAAPAQETPPNAPVDPIDPLNSNVPLLRA